MLRRSSLLLLLALVWLQAAPAGATAIQVTATDLNDALGPGGDLWELSFAVSGRTFAVDQGFSVLFDPTLYADLVPLPAQPSPDWDVLVLQPDPALPADGLYDALALVDAPSLAVAFVTRVIWLGGGAGPVGGQPFTVNQFASDGSLQQVLESGAQVVPEPALVMLLLPAAAAALLRRRPGR